jgi:hypothetical protein
MPEQFLQGRFFHLLKEFDLAGINDAGDEQSIDAIGMRDGKVCADRIADSQHALMRRITAGFCFRQRHGAVIDRAVRLAVELKRRRRLHGKVRRSCQGEIGRSRLPRHFMFVTLGAFDSICQLSALVAAPAIDGHIPSIIVHAPDAEQITIEP